MSAVLGAIAALTDASLTVSDDAGASDPFIVNDHTMRIAKDSQVLDPSQFTVGGRVVVLPLETPDGVVALVVLKCGMGGGDGGG